jgi:hypothetical protein
MAVIHQKSVGPIKANAALQGAVSEVEIPDSVIISDDDLAVGIAASVNYSASDHFLAHGVMLPRDEILRCLISNVRL